MITMERFKKLVDAKTDSLWKLYLYSLETYGEQDEYVIHKQIEWGTWFEIKQMLETEKYFGKIEKIYVEEDV